MTMDKAGFRLTSKEAAQILKVSEASIKRWSDSGLLPSERTAGGHRRFRPEDIARFRREYISSRPTSIINPLNLKLDISLVDSSSLNILELLIKGQSDEVTDLLINLHLQGHSFASILDDVVAKAMHNIGELWCSGDVTVAQEHIATQTTLSALRNLHDVIAKAETNSMVALCCGIEDDFHELPVHFVQMLLENEGWIVINLGGHTPIFSLMETVIKYSPNLVCISSNILTSLDRAARDYKELRKITKRMNISIAVGGAGFSKEVRPRFPAEFYADDFKQLLEFSNQLLSQAHSANN
jgi:MerR family transcriptional regulator, light-induced transcriptional regulator